MALVGISFLASSNFVNAATFSASAFGGFGTRASCAPGDGNSETVSSGSASASYGTAALGCVGSSMASAGAGVLSIAGEMTINHPSDPLPDGWDWARGFASARASLSGDIHVVAAEGFSAGSLSAIYGDSIDLTMNLGFTGSLDATMTPTFRNATKSGGASMSVTASLGDKQVSQSYYASAQGGRTSDDLNAVEVLNEQVSVTANKQWGDPINVSMSLFGSAGAFDFTLGKYLNTSFDAANSLTFRQDAPVFDLPPGFTVFSTDFNIVDNMWIDPRIPPPNPSSVPLPAGLSLLLGAFGVLGVIRLRSKPMSS